jgi:hypothetical protein
LRHQSSPQHQKESGTKPNNTTHRRRSAENNIDMTKIIRGRPSVATTRDRPTEVGGDTSEGTTPASVEATTSRRFNDPNASCATMKRSRPTATIDARAIDASTAKEWATPISSARSLKKYALTAPARERAAVRRGTPVNDTKNGYATRATTRTDRCSHLEGLR